MRTFDRETAQYLNRIREEIDDRITAEPHLMQRDTFVQIVSEYMVEDGVSEDLQPCFFRAPAGRQLMEAAGYGIGADGTVLEVAVVELGLQGKNIAQQRVIQRFREVERFVDKCRTGLHLQLEPTSPSYDMAQRIGEIWPKLEKVRLFLLTDGQSSLKQLDNREIEGTTVTRELWDLKRIGRLFFSTSRQEELDIDLSRETNPVTCLPAPDSAEGFRCMLALIPGQLLADLYELHGSRLLQRNVRAFLQNRNKVNRGINATVKNEPAYFLPYNNGISATARHVETVIDDEGVRRITRIVDPQIVNGGQTTASLHHAHKREKADLSGILVPAKITVVEDDRLEDLVSKISRYANSQNVIKEADFEANSEFHVKLEELSRSLWTPAAEGSTEQHRWYYERVRGQFGVETAREGTAAKRAAFKRQNRKFTKTDAAKYEAVWLGKPHVATLGAEKCFQWWTTNIVKDRDLPDADGFKNLVAKGILFESIRRDIHARKLGGYLIQLSAFVVSLLVQRFEGTIELEEIWRLQEPPARLSEAAQELVDLVRPKLIYPPGSANVTEWCKKEACWEMVQQVEWTPRARPL
jgi:hypothetical protein